MRQRTITAIVFAAAMLGGIFGGKITFFTLFALITGGTLWEYSGLLFQSQAHLPLRRMVCVLWGLAPYLLVGGSALGFWGGAQTFAGLTLLLLSAAFFLLLELFLQAEKPFNNVGYFLGGVFYISLPFTLLTYLSMPNGEFFNGDQYNPWRIFGLLLLIWANDTFAYLIGSRLGRQKLLERISPKKTWEGFVGGGICAVLVAWGLSHELDAYTPGQWLALAGVAVVFGTLGDLVESMLKRSLDIKDSGSLLPGHGGLLDRFDAFLFAIPFYWLVLVYV